MSKTFFSTILLLLPFLSFSQTEDPGSLKKQLSLVKDDSSAYVFTKQLRDYYVERNYDSALYYGYQLMSLSDKTKNIKHKVDAYQALGYTYGTVGNVTVAMEMILEAKKLAEQEEDKRQLGSCFHLLGNLYAAQQNYKEAVANYKLAAAAVENDTSSRSFTYTSLMNLGDAYRRMKMLDSALHYEQRAYEKALRQSKAYFPHVLANLGLIHHDLGNNELALYYFTAGISEAKNQGSPARTIGGIYESLSKFFKTTGKIDSAIYYGRAAVAASEGTPFGNRLATAYLNMSHLYANNTDSAYKYLKAANVLKDSLNTMEKVTQFQALHYQEELRETQLLQKKAESEIQRKQNMQYAAIGGGVLVLFMLFLLLSRSVIVTENFIKFLGVIVLLVVFEFINLFLHPYLGAWTHHSPIWMLLIMVAIAGVLVPLHHKMEHWMTHQMVEKNKKIRVAAAKKTLAKLDTNT